MWEPTHSLDYVEAAVQDRRDGGETVTVGWGRTPTMATTKKTAEKTTESDLRAAGAVGQPVATREAAHAVAASIMGEAGAAPDHVAAREAPPTNVKFVALRTFDYGGRALDRGQIFTFAGLPNDGRLRDLRYAAPLERGTSSYECGACGAQFTAMGLRDGHAKVRHLKQRFVPPAAPIREPGESIDTYQNRLDDWAKAAGAMADAADDQRDKFENDVAPLDLEKTAASRA